MLSSTSCQCYGLSCLMLGLPSFGTTVDYSLASWGEKKLFHQAAFNNVICITLTGNQTSILHQPFYIPAQQTLLCCLLLTENTSPCRLMFNSFFNTSQNIPTIPLPIIGLRLMLLLLWKIHNKLKEHKHLISVWHSDVSVHCRLSALVTCT